MNLIQQDLGLKSISQDNYIQYIMEEHIENNNGLDQLDTNLKHFLKVHIDQDR